MWFKTVQSNQKVETMAAMVTSEPDTGRITAFIPTCVVDVLDEEARLNYGSRASVIRRVLSEWAERRAADRQSPG